MITAMITWCTCRVETILTLGKLLSLWFCFLLHSIFFLISQTSYRTYKIISSYELARPVMGTIFLVAIDTLVQVFICLSSIVICGGPIVNYAIKVLLLTTTFFLPIMTIIMTFYQHKRWNLLTLYQIRNRIC